MLTAFIYREIKDENIDIKESKIFMFCWKLTAPIMLFCIFGAPFIFSTYHFEKPALWSTIYGTVHRNMFGLMIGIIILGYSAKLGGQWREFFNASLFKPLGKVNYGFYLSHLTILKLVIGDKFHPLNMSVVKVVSIVHFLMDFFGLCDFVIKSQQHLQHHVHHFSRNI